MNELFKGILEWIYSWTGNYGFATVIFTVLVRTILFPFDYKSRVSMRKTSKLQPKLAALQKKYANDKEKLSQKQAELYKKEKINPLSSCLPMLLMYPILIWMFTAMRFVSYEHITTQVLTIFNNPNVLPTFDGWLWIKNLWMPDSPFSSSLPDLTTLSQVSADTWIGALSANNNAGLTLLQNFTLDGATMPLAELTLESFSTNLQGTVQSIYAVLGQTPVYLEYATTVDGWTINLFITTISLQKLWNGLYLLPLMAAGSQLLMTKLMGNNNPAADPQMQQQQNSMKFMNYFFPLFTLWICSSYNGMFTAYWVTGNLIAMVQTVCINKYLDKKEKLEAEKNLEVTK